MATSCHSCCMYVLAGRSAFSRPYEGVHRSTSLMSSSLLLQQCPACLVRLTWIVLVMGDKIRKLGENETNKYLGILEADTIKQVERKDKNRKEYLRRTRKLLETKLSCRNHLKGINTWLFPSLDIRDPVSSGPEMNLNGSRHYIPETKFTDYMYLEKKMLASKIALAHRYNGSKTT